MQATVDTRPEDLLITPVVEGAARLKYVASPLLTAVIRGGVAILDEGNRMSEKSWASLAEFALRLRRYLLAHRPGVVAVELPSALDREYRGAIGRLPQMSVILIPPEDEDIDEAPATYIPVEPADPFIEAIRTAGECGAEVLFLEPATRENPQFADDYPDAHAVEVIGMEQYVEAYRLQPQPRTDVLESHAAAMAWKLQGADPVADVCVIVSLNLLDPLLDAMDMPQEEPARRDRSFFEPRSYSIYIPIAWRKSQAKRRSSSTYMSGRGWKPTRAGSNDRVGN